METQNKIKQTLTQLEAIEDINNKLESNGKINRTELANSLCDHFHFIDPRGKRQRDGCLMIQDHPRGAGPLVGRQLRYLVESEHGWLGGISFSSAALHLEDRDKWIGWIGITG